jgi:hypothetical protein
MSTSATRAEIESYATYVLRNKIRCELPFCLVCNTQPTSFKRHQARPRKFRIRCDMLVQLALCLVIRWKCPGCNKTFTQQPPFALSRKRFTRETILDTSGYYLEDEASTYRKAVLEEGAEIFYASTTREDTPGYKTLNHSTPYRWISSLGGFKEILRYAQDVILQKDPASTVCRDLAALEIAPQKYVKAAREGVLKRCRQLIHLEAKFRATFHASIFPFFATSCAWR